MILGTWKKQPYELEPITVDFSLRLAVDETITDATVTAKDANTGLNAIGLLVGPTTIDGGFVTKLVQGGLTGFSYIVEYRAQTSRGYQLEDEVGVTVIET